MKKSFRSLAIWICFAIVLVILFNIYPQAARQSSFVVILFLIALPVALWRGIKSWTFSWKRTVRGKITAKHLFAAATVLGVVPFVWMALLFPYLRADTTASILLIIVPALVMIACASLLFGIGIYFAMVKNSKDS